MAATPSRGDRRASRDDPTATLSASLTVSPDAGHPPEGRRQLSTRWTEVGCKVGCAINLAREQDGASDQFAHLLLAYRSDIWPRNTGGP